MVTGYGERCDKSDRDCLNVQRGFLRLSSDLRAITRSGLYCLVGHRHSLISCIELPLSNRLAQNALQTETLVPGVSCKLFGSPGYRERGSASRPCLVLFLSDLSAFAGLGWGRGRGYEHLGACVGH